MLIAHVQVLHTLNK